jgi:magnesium transporter
MKKLASWAAIISVPTAVTGWFGQNLPYPGFEAVSGLVASAVLILAGTVGLYLLFRRIDWL